MWNLKLHNLNGHIHLDTWGSVNISQGRTFQKDDYIRMIEDLSIILSEESDKGIIISGFLLRWVKYTSRLDMMVLNALEKFRAA